MTATESNSGRTIDSGHMMPNTSNSALNNGALTLLDPYQCAIFSSQHTMARLNSDRDVDDLYRSHSNMYTVKFG